MAKGKKKQAGKKKTGKAQEAQAPAKRVKLITDNRKARHLYLIEDQIEAGLMLTGTEVKSCRQGKANLTDAYGLENKGEFYLHQAHISPYDRGNLNNHEPKRMRKLLMHKREVNKLYGKIREKGYTLVPLKMYFKGPWVKVLLGLGKGKKLYDKRASLKEKQHKRDVERALKER